MLLNLHCGNGLLLHDVASENSSCCRLARSTSFSRSSPTLYKKGPRCSCPTFWESLVTTNERWLRSAWTCVLHTRGSRSETFLLPSSTRRFALIPKRLIIKDGRTESSCCDASAGTGMYCRFVLKGSSHPAERGPCPRVLSPSRPCTQWFVAVLIWMNTLCLSLAFLFGHDGFVLSLVLIPPQLLTRWVAVVNHPTGASQQPLTCITKTTNEAMLAQFNDPRDTF